MAPLGPHLPHAGGEELTMSLAGSDENLPDQLIKDEE